jgi:hypothetical protein
MLLNKIHVRRAAAGLLLGASAVAVMAEEGNAVIAELVEAVDGMFEADAGGGSLGETEGLDPRFAALAVPEGEEQAAGETEESAGELLEGEAESESLVVAKVFTVSDRTQLIAALTEAQGLAGAEIRLLPGDYGVLRWTSKSYPLGRVFIRAAESTPPLFTEFSLSGSSSIAVSGIRVASLVSPAVQLSGTTDVIFAGNFVSGGTSTTTDPWDDGNAGVHVREARRVTLSNNQFENLRSAAFVQRSTAVTFEQNTIRNVREGVNVAAATNLDLRNNRFERFSPKYPNGEHADAIQFWTSNETQGSSDVRIIENAILLGGCKSVQGIFIRSETENSSTATQVRHSNFEIRRNIYYGSARNGLSVSSVDGAVVANNVIVASPYGLSGITRAEVTDERCSGALVPGILSRFGGTTHRFSDNITHVIGSTEGTREDDISIGSGAGDFKWTQVFKKQPTSDIPAISEFVTRTPSSVRTRGIGVLDSYMAGKTLGESAALTRALSVHKN